MNQRLVILILLLFCHNLLADSEIIYLRKPVLISFPGMEKIKITFEKGTSLPLGTRIDVRKGGLLVFRGEDGSVVKVDEGGKLEITKMDSKGQKQGETLYSLVKGSAFFKFPKNKERAAGVRTKTASMGVRGTQFFVANAKEDSARDVWMCVNEGLVAVTTKKISHAIDVKAGEGVKIAAGVDISTPRPLAWTKKLNWQMDPDQGNLDNTVSIEEAYASPLDLDID